MQTMNSNEAAVAVYPDHEEAEVAVKALQHGGFEMRKLSIVGADYHSEEHVVGYYNTGERMKAWGKNGAFWGGIWGLFFGTAVFFIPGIGPIAVAGPLVVALVAALENALLLGGLSALGAGLAGLGIPKDSVLRYETELKAGKFLVIAHGSRQDAERAKEILSHAGLTAPELHAGAAA